METFTSNIQSVEQKEKSPTKLVFQYDMNTQVKRVLDVYARKKHFIEKDFKPSLPTGLPSILSDEVPDERKVTQAVEAEYRGEVFLSFAEKIQKEWDNEELDFMGKLREINSLLPYSIKINLTTYGVGGSYWIPDQVYMNVAWIRPEEDRMRLFMHEISHLAIEESVKSNSILHWEKEFLVELIMTKVAPHKSGRLEEVRSKADATADTVLIVQDFESLYPDVNGVITRLAERMKSEKNII
jgi:hypothetical protein